MLIKLTIGNETRELDVPLIAGYVVVHDIKMTTTTGSKEHIGSVFLRPNESNIYTLKDVIRITYPGMRGNGIAEYSKFRSIRF